MNTTKVIAIALLCTGTASLIYEGITHTSDVESVIPETLQMRMMKEQKIIMNG